MYIHKIFPQDFNPEDFQLTKLARISDVITGVHCFIRVLELPEEYAAFNPSQREIGKVEALENIAEGQINPLTKVALKVMTRGYGFDSSILSQIKNLGLSMPEHYILSRYNPNLKKKGEPDEVILTY
jgi:hypothetical protein